MTKILKWIKIELTFYFINVMFSLTLNYRLKSAKERGVLWCDEEVFNGSFHDFCSNDCHVCCDTKYAG